MLKNFKNISLFSLCILLPLKSFADTYELENAHTSIEFGVKHLGISNVKGSFNNFKGEIQYDPSKPEETKVTAEIDASSLDTSNAKRDEHVKSKDFLDVGIFPKIKFVSKEAKLNGPNSLLVTGDLTILGITKPITLLVNDIVGPVVNPMDKKAHVGAVVTGKLIRQDFGVTWNGGGMTGAAGEAAIGNEIKLQFEIDGVKK
jgi:polyisoprenoid-binding protein YceI